LGDFEAPECLWQLDVVIGGHVVSCCD
jgi:hypothetical protein